MKTAPEIVKFVRIENRSFVLVRVSADSLDSYASIDFDRNVISLSKGVGDGIFAVEMVLHEVLHGLLDGYDFPEDAEKCEELIVKRLSQGLVRFMRDNVELVKEGLSLLGTGDTRKVQT